MCTATPTAVIAVGTGRYADPWHPLEHTARTIADVLTEDGWRVTVDPDVDGALTRLDGADLLVVVAADPWRNDESEVRRSPEADAGLSQALARGVGVLAVHSALSTLRDYPQWRAALGGEWVVGTSWHPPLGPLTVTFSPGPFTSDSQPPMQVEDERYTDLAVDDDVHVVAAHVDGAVTHPLVWWREDGRSRVVASALGHDARSWQEPAHQQLIVRAARWAARH